MFDVTSCWAPGWGGLLSLLSASLHPHPPSSRSSLPFFQGEPGKAGEKGLAGAPGLRVSVLLTA